MPVSEQQKKVVAAAAGLAIVLIVAAIFSRGCVSEIKTHIGNLFSDLGSSQECQDGLDNDGDGMVDTQGGHDGEPADEKCLALNGPRESNNLALQNSASVGPDGGLLVLGDLQIHIPQGALIQNTLVSIERIPGVAPEVFSTSDVYDLKPTGLTFQKPIILSFHLHPEDPNAPQDPWVFTEVNGEPVFSSAVISFNVAQTRSLTVTSNHFSKKGVKSFNEFIQRYHATPVQQNCFQNYPVVACQDRSPLCHGGIGNSQPCSSCLPVPDFGSGFCCICPEGLDADFPCTDQNNNRIEIFSTPCRRYQYPVQGSCMEQMNHWILDDDGQRYASITFPYLSVDGVNVDFTNLRQQGGQTCGTPVLSNLSINLTTQVGYPNWTGSGSCQQEWNRFIAGVQAHEEGHAKIGATEADRLKSEITALVWNEKCASSRSQLQTDAEAMVKKDVYQKQDEVQNEWNNLEKNYESTTDHGRTQGATLDCGGCQ